PSAFASSSCESPAHKLSVASRKFMYALLLTGGHASIILHTHKAGEAPMNRVPLARRVQIINCLVEGNSIRSTERMTGTHRDTIMRLLVEVGEGCAKLMDEKMRDLPCRRLQVDEIWAFVQKKQRQVTPADDRARVGHQWTF